MPSTYSQNLRLELMADGEDDSSWGDKTNATLALIDTAIAGVTQLDITGLSSVTLSANTGTPDQARAAVLEIVGTMSSNCTITWPSSTQVACVLNYATAPGGVYKVTLAQNGFPATVTLPYQGGGFFVMSSGVSPLGGTQLFVAALNVAGNVLLGGTVASIGDVDVGGNLNVNGSATVSGPGSFYSLSASGSVNAGGFLAVTGNASAANFSTTGQVIATQGLSTSGTLTVTGTASTGALSVTGGVTATGNVSGANLTTTGQVIGTGGLSTSGALTVVGSASFSGAVTMSNNVTFNGGVAVFDGGVAINYGGGAHFNLLNIGAFANDAAAAAAGYIVGDLYINSNNGQLTIRYG